MQAAYMEDQDSTYTVDHWMRDLIKHLLNLSHEQWLARNLMKHHHTKGMLAIQTREELHSELDKLLDKDIHNIPARDRWMLDLQESDIDEMSIRQLQYSVFALRAADKQDNTMMLRKNDRTKDFMEHIEMDDVAVPTGNEFNSDGSVEEQKEEERKERTGGKPDNPSRNTRPGQRNRPNGKRGQNKAETANRTKQQEENAKKERKRQRKYEARIRGDSTAAHVNFNKSLPSRAATRQDHLNTLGGTKIPQAESSTVTAMLKPIQRR